jgi:hypothetical protein
MPSLPKTTERIQRIQKALARDLAVLLADLVDDPSNPSTNMLLIGLLLDVGCPKRLIPVLGLALVKAIELREGHNNA